LDACTCNVFKNPKLPTEPQGCPLSGSGSYVNTGVFVIRPSSHTYAKLVDYDYDHQLPDQDAFNEYFKNRIHLLDPSYNYMLHLSLAHPEVDSKDAKVVHFTYDKPWKMEEEKRMPLCQIWRVLWKSVAIAITKEKA
jgi:lipopolysaccharide biosynthesis glycosyltransferase